MKQFFKVTLTSIFICLLTYPWWSLALFKIYYLNQGNVEGLKHNSKIEELSIPNHDIKLKSVELKGFQFSIPEGFSLETDKSDDNTLSFQGEDKERILIFKGVRDKEGFIDSCPQLKDIHTLSLNDLSLFSLNILRAHEIARALMIRKVSDMPEQKFHLYQKGEKFVTILHPNEKMSIIETQRDCDLLTITLVNISEDLRVNLLAPIITNSLL